MKVLLLSTSLAGGAGGAAYRLHQGLRDIGVSSHVLVRTKQVNDANVVVSNRPVLAKLLRKAGQLTGQADIDKSPLKRYPNRNGSTFSVQWMPDRIASEVARLRPDVINLHWTCGGWMKIESISKLAKPVVWTLHDMWPFTGGCHYSQGCGRYGDNCGACPQLASSKERDLSRWIWRRKAKAFKDLDLTIVTPSSWLANCARSSSLFRDQRIEVISNGIDTENYRPIDRKVAREALNLPQDKRIVLFGAWSNDPRKGLQLLVPALQSIIQSGWNDKLMLVAFGFSRPGDFPDLGIKAYFLGKLNDTISLALAYSAADVLVVPSTEETFGLVIVESLSCGTPVVAFDATGPKDLIEHMRNGFLSKPFDVTDLSQGISWVLEDMGRHQRLSHRAREKAEQEYTMERYVRRYRDLFSEILENHKAKSPV